jgi:uncharacterized NAD(P)/FAD-binding protein YdhS
MQRIAVIGGGAAGAAVVGEFLRQGSYEGLALTWLVGRVSAPGRGIAYSTDCAAHVLNVRAANMGLFKEDVAAFARYAQQRDASVRPSDFLPRSWYGDYIEQTIRQLRLLHAPSCTLDVVHAEAAATRLDRDGYRIRLDDGDELAVDGFVLAPGAPPALPLPYAEGRSIASGRYLLDP